MKVVAAVMFLLVWAYGMVRAETWWKFVPAVGHVIGAICIIEDYAPAPKANTP